MTRKACSNALFGCVDPLRLEFRSWRHRLPVGSIGLVHLDFENEPHPFSLNSEKVIYGMFESTVDMFNGKSVG